MFRTDTGKSLIIPPVIDQNKPQMAKRPSLAVLGVSSGTPGTLLQCTLPGYTCAAAPGRRNSTAAHVPRCQTCSPATETVHMDGSMARWAIFTCPFCALLPDLVSADP